MKGHIVLPPHEGLQIVPVADEFVIEHYRRQGESQVYEVQHWPQRYSSVRAAEQALKQYSRRK